MYTKILIKNKKILYISESSKGNLMIKAKGESVKNKSTKNEIRIFKKFAKLCRYSINPNSIKKKDPPEPDISCSLSDGSILAFELVEIIDKNYARVFYAPFRLKEALKQQSQKRKQFEVNFNNALIDVAFNEKNSFRRKMNSVPRILNYLLTLDKTAKGIFKPQNLIKIVKDISIRRGFTGPKFHVVHSGAYIYDPCKEKIKSKFFEKNYKISSRTELLAYYDLQPFLPENNLFHECQKFIIEHIKKSVFQRVWIYSGRENEIVFIHPNFEMLNR